MNENTRANNFRKEFRTYIKNETNKDLHIVNLLDSKGGDVKPYDCYFSYNNCFVGIEFKRNVMQSINPSDLRDNQVDGLLEAYRSGSNSTGLVVYFLDHAKYANKYLFACPIQIFMQHFQIVEVGGGKYEFGKSQKIDQLIEEFPYLFIDRKQYTMHDGTKKTMWNFNNILNIVKKNYSLNG